MLGALRRCPTSLPRAIRPATVVARSVRASVPFEPTWGSARPSSIRSALAVRGFHQSCQRYQSAAEAMVEEDTSGLITRFEDLADKGIVHPNVIKTVTGQMRLETMTEVQSMTINQAIQGNDMIAQAKTGTGKTVAFLLPILQRIINSDPRLGQVGRVMADADDIRALIISPTRELAEQIAEEARKMVRKTGIVVQTAVGGSHKRADLSRMKRQGCHILVGTPGRLKDIFSDPSTGVEAPKLDVLVLDEADRLMDQGFWPEINQIQQLLPDPRKKDRQTLMFSATVPREVVSLVRQTLKPGFDFVQTVDEDDQPTHERVKQHFVQVRALENALPTLFELCHREINAAADSGGRPFKAIVYFNSTAETKMASRLFTDLRRQLGRTRTFEIHSKLTQVQRTTASDYFRKSSNAILFSSDVTARGMDFPDVTHVIQMGLPQQAETYVHRLGRTARAGKEGEGWLILSAPLQSRYDMRALGQLPIQENTSLKTAQLDMSQAAELDVQTAGILNAMSRGFKHMDPETFQGTYRALFGVNQKVRDKQLLVDAMNDLAKYGWGLSKPPAIPRSLAAKLNLGRVDGLQFEPDHHDRRGGFGGRDAFDRDGGRDFGSRGGRRDDSRFGGFGGRDQKPRKGVFRGGF